MATANRDLTLSESRYKAAERNAYRPGHELPDRVLRYLRDLKAEVRDLEPDRVG